MIHHHFRIVNDYYTPFTHAPTKCTYSAKTRSSKPVNQIKRTRRNGITSGMILSYVGRVFPRVHYKTVLSLHLIVIYSDIRKAKRVDDIFSLG